MASFTIRDMTPADLPEVRRIQTETLFLGAPLPFPVADLDRLVAYWVDYYVLQEPEAGAIVLDADGRVAGYSVGAARPAAMDAWQRRRALALAGLWLRRWRDYDPFTRQYYRLRLRDALAVLRSAHPRPEAYFHWNVLSTVRGRVIWSLLRRFREFCLARGLRSFGGDYPQVVSRRNESAWERLGIRITHRAPHQTLTWLAGEPVERLGLATDVDSVRV